MPGAYRSAAAAGPAFDARAVVLDAEVPGSRAVYVGTGGDLVVDMVSGAQVTFAAVPAGTLLPIQVSKVRTAGTTAAQLLLLY